MKRSLLVAATVLVAVNVWAGDPWQKSYKQWDASDVRKILDDSPWSKTVEIERRLSLQAPSGGPKLAGAPGVDDEDEQEEPGDDDQRRGGPERKKDDPRFRIRWLSSRTLREASVRGQVLQGKIPETDADKYLPPPALDYELVLVGVDMSPFQKMDESTLQKRTHLIAKRSKQNVMASQVEVVRTSDGKRINAIVFHFPKQSSSGQVLVTADEKELKFVTRTETIEIKARFELNRMIDTQGMDLL